MVTNREKWALWRLLKFHIYRYLMANTYHRLDGGEKASQHIEISKILCQFILMEDKDWVSWRGVHDYLAEILTDRMDEVIGFPITESIYGDEYDVLAKKFFAVVISKMDEIEVTARQDAER